MKLDITFDKLWQNVAAMGAERRTFELGDVGPHIDIEFDTQLSSASGIDADISDVAMEEGLLSYKGRQVLLFIPDHSNRKDSIETVLADPSKGNRYHVADCEHLVKMRKQNRYNRYKVTNNIDGDFDIYGNGSNKQLVDGKAALNVCQFCLSKLNYKGADNEGFSGRKKIATEFKLLEFFSKYSSLFKYYPKTRIEDAHKGYTDDWDKVSLKVRTASNYSCGHCNVSLIHHKGLLHTHHLNGEKSDNSAGNLIPLCADCHRKEPYHDHMQVKHADVQLLNRLRREQGLLESNDWEKVFKYADPATHGVLLHCQKHGYSAPEVGYEAANDIGEVVAEFEIAWPHKKTAVVLQAEVPVEGWRVFGLNDAVAFFGRELQKQ
jgi:hypothetical protein